MPDLSRYTAWLDWLRSRAESDPDVLAARIGGSAATGGWDEWSDLDVDVLCRPGTAVAAYGRWVAGMEEDFSPASIWHTPEDLHEDGRQCFVAMSERPGLLLEPTILVDLVMVDVTDEHRHVDVRLHGTPIVLRDPEGLLVLREEDPAELAKAMDAAVDQVRQKRATGEWLVNRALARGHVAEGLDLYVRFGLHSLVRLLRAEHCPWRHGFGLRYLREDLPADVADRLEALVPGAGPADLKALSAACFAWQDELLAPS